MNNQMEVQKIKVNNGQKLIAEAQKWKSSGGEWKLLEDYFQMPSKDNETSEYAKWGIIISNGRQRIELYSQNNRQNNCQEDSIVNALEKNSSVKELKKIFPEISQTYFSKTHFFPHKETIVENQGKFLTSRKLNAWSVADVLKIITEFYKENKNEIQNSITSLGIENSLKWWIKFGNNEDTIFFFD
ncbi:MAG: hypothetical protein mread185_000633 [Mycoplasmataceae bacterium]|nr:MAG: hypothetical protein mread185_000633 [Mycoplasmataceae bacterium]